MEEGLGGEEVGCCEEERGEERDWTGSDDVAQVAQKPAVSGGSGKLGDWRRESVVEIR